MQLQPIKNWLLKLGCTTKVDTPNYALESSPNNLQHIEMFNKKNLLMSQSQQV